MSKHDELVMDLVERLRKSSVDYVLVEHNLQYGSRHHVIGEMDIVALNHHSALVGEVKSHDSEKFRRKAISQLERAEKCCPLLEGYRCFKFYIYWIDYDEGIYGLECIN